MVHSDLLVTIVAAIVAAFLGGYVAVRLRLPSIVGYLLAGVAIGPFTPGGSANTQVAAELAEVGVILLMFGVGIHFSLRDLLAVRGVAIPGAIGQIAVATALGTLLGLGWGWDLLPALILGLAISVASTVVLLRALDDRGALDSSHGHTAIGWLIVEDLFTVVVLVLLPVLAMSLAGDASGGGVVALAAPVALALAKAVVFVAVMLVVGGRVIPWLLSDVAATGSRELFTLAVLASALGIAFGSAVLFGVSLALGAFVAGVVVSESRLSHRAAADALPLRDAFAVLFFVSVGMLFNPAVLVEAPLRLLALLAIIIGAKALTAFVIVLALRRPPRTALTVAAGLAQIGEFSFIVISVGGGLGLFPAEGTNLVLAAALLSITLNPLLFATIGPIERLLLARGVADGVAAGSAPPAADEPEPLSAASGHAVICGFGRVGARVAGALTAAGWPHLVVEQDHRIATDLRAARRAVVEGNAVLEPTLRRAGVPEAAVVVVAVPDAPTVGEIVCTVRRLNPSVPVIARSHGDAAQRQVLREGATTAVVGEHELAAEMARQVLAALATPDGPAGAVLDPART